MKLRWSETALAEVENIFSFIYENNRTAATAIVQRIEGLTALLEEFPFVGHLTDEPEVRVCPWCAIRSMRSTTQQVRSSSCMCGIRLKSGRRLRHGYLAASASASAPYSAAALRDCPTNPVSSPKRSTITAGRSLALLVTQAPERTV